MNFFTDLLKDIKEAWVMATTGATTGTATFLDWIPADIGKLGTLISILLALVLIYTHLVKLKRAKVKDELEIAVLRRTLEQT